MEPPPITRPRGERSRRGAPERDRGSARVPAHATAGGSPRAGPTIYACVAMTMTSIVTMLTIAHVIGNACPVAWSSDPCHPWIHARRGPASMQPRTYRQTWTRLSYCIVYGIACRCDFHSSPDYPASRPFYLANAVTRCATMTRRYRPDPLSSVRSSRNLSSSRSHSHSSPTSSSNSSAPLRQACAVTHTSA